MLNWIVCNRTICIKINLALNNLQKLIFHKPQTTKQLFVAFAYQVINFLISLALLLHNINLFLDSLGHKDIWAVIQRDSVIIILFPNHVCNLPQLQLVAFHWSLRDKEWCQVSGAFLRVLTVLNNTDVWIV